MTPALRALMNRYAMPTFERQLRLQELLGEDHDWRLSLADGTATFGPGQTWPIQLLGTKSDESNSWLWAWANEGAKVPKALLTAAKKVRQTGKKRSVEELEREEWPLHETSPHTLALVATGVAELGAYYRFGYEGGALFAGIEARVLPPPPPPDPDRMERVVREVLERFEVDPRLAFQNYAQARGAQVEAGRERIAARWPQDGVSLVATFDASGALVGLDRGDAGSRAVSAPGLRPQGAV